MGGLYHDICEKFQKILFTEIQILLSTSSSTGLMEGAIRNCVQEKVLHVVIGAFGDRWHQISIDNEKHPDKLEIGWGNAASAEQNIIIL